MQQQLIFGTDGVRCPVGNSPLTATDLPQLGRAIERWAHYRYGNQPGILIAHDTRISCAWIKAALKIGLLSSKIKIYDAHCLPTPAVSALSKQHEHINCGIVISASHNPYQDNGIKILDHVGRKICSEDRDYICTEYEKFVSPISYTNFGTDELYMQAQNAYEQLLLSFFTVPFLEGKKIVLDCGNGALSGIAQRVFTHIGAQTYVLNAAPNGFNINDHCGSLYPEIIKHAVIEYDADLGFAFDGDGDRIVAVNKAGLLFDGDAIIAHLLDHPEYAQESGVVTTIMSNSAFISFLENKKRKLIQTAVGDSNVAAELIGRNWLIGGEASGHIILRDFIDGADGLFTALRFAQTCAFTNNWDKAPFTPHPKVTFNISVERTENLDQNPYAAIIENHRKQLTCGKLIVRYSGTEQNIIRITVEAHEKNRAHTIAASLAECLQKKLSFS